MGIISTVIAWTRVIGPTYVHMTHSTRCSFYQLTNSTAFVLELERATVSSTLDLTRATGCASIVI